jgi:hypothetical protein
MNMVVIPVEVPAAMPLPQSAPTLSVISLSVAPNPDGSIALTATIRPGAITLPGSPLTFSVPALLKFLQDLAAVMPSLIADLQAIFGAAVQENSQK